MEKYCILANKLRCGSKINLLFVAPYTVETNYFDKAKFNCDVWVGANDNLLGALDSYDCLISLCGKSLGIDFYNELEKQGMPYVGPSKRILSLHDFDLQVAENTDSIHCSEYETNEYTALVFTDKWDDVICLNPVCTDIDKSSYMSGDFDYVMNKINIDNSTSYEIKKKCKYIYKNLNLSSYVKIDIKRNEIVVYPMPEIFCLEKEISMSDIIINEFYDYNEFLVDVLCETVDKHGGFTATLQH